MVEGLPRMQPLASNSSQKGESGVGGVAFFLGTASGSNPGQGSVSVSVLMTAKYKSWQGAREMVVSCPGRLATSRGEFYRAVYPESSSEK